MSVSSVRFPPGAKSISPDTSPAEIMKSLKRCNKFFSQLDQDQEEEKKIYHPFCMYIVESDLISEIADANARLHLGCIFSDIFRLYAPENPFPHDKTKDIFLFITTQLSHLQNTKSAMYARAFHILGNVAAVKSFIICMELDNTHADEIFYDLFKVLFSVVNSSHDSKLKATMLDVMVSIVSEMETLPSQVFNIVLECLLEKCQKLNSSAYELAREFIRKTAQSIKITVMLFFQDAILEDHENLSLLMKNWPRLLLELCKISDSFFVDVAPQLEMKLRTDSHRQRLQVVRLIASLYAEKDSGFALLHNSLWESFIARFNDIQPDIRKECVNFCSKMIVNHAPDVLSDQKHIKALLDELKSRRHDTDEGVRSAVIVAIRHITIQCPHLTTEELLVFLRERLLDKKPKVRETAIRAVADVNKKLVDNASTSISTTQKTLLQSHLLRVYYTQNFDDCILIERIFVGSLVQYNLPEQERIQRFLDLYCTVDVHAIKAVAEMFKRQKLLRTSLKSLVSAIDAAETGNELWQCVLNVASHMQNPQQGRDIIKKLIDVVGKDKTVRTSLTCLLSDGYTCHSIGLATRDILKRIDHDGCSRQFRQVVQQLLERAVIVPIVVDSNAIICLGKMVSEMLSGSWAMGHGTNAEGQSRALDLLVLLANHDPSLFADNESFEILLGLLKVKSDDVTEKVLQVFLKTSSAIESKFRAVRAILLPELKVIATSSTPKLVKYAVHCISSFISVRETPLMQLFHEAKEFASENLEPNIKLRSLLTRIGCIAECLPDCAGREMKGFVGSILVKQLIMKSNLKRVKKKDVRWCDMSDISEETATKLVSMKCIVRWLKGLRSNDSDCCGSTIRLLQHMMHNDGDLMKCGCIPKAEMAYLRLEAALCTIRIARCQEYKELISTQILAEVAGIMMDEVREVRKLLLSKLYRSLMKFQLPVCFMALFYVLSQEKLKEAREQGANMYRQLVSRFRSVAQEHSVQRITPEYALSYAIHLIANDPDSLATSNLTNAALSRMKDSLQFMLDPLLTREHPDSFGFIKRLAELIKRTRSQCHSKGLSDNKTLYAVCDLVLQLVLAKSAQYAIGIIEPPDEAIKRFLPTKLYSTLSKEENRQIYLPEAFQVEPKLIPVKSGMKSTVKANIPPQGKLSQKKLPRKLVAVTTIPISLPSTNEKYGLKSKPTASNESLSSKRSKRVLSEDDSSSDEEFLSKKRMRIMTERMKKKSNSDTSGCDSPEKSSLGSLNTNHARTRPKRSSAGRKMMEILNSIKRSPLKAKNTSADSSKSKGRSKSKETMGT